MSVCLLDTVVFRSQATKINSQQHNKNTYLITKFGPKIDHLIQSIKPNSHTLKDARGIRGIFLQPTVHACKQPPNLRQLLSSNSTTDDEPRCNKLCGKHRCKVCKHINTATNACNNHKTVTPGNNNCDSANVVYLIHFQKCHEAQYIAETSDTDIIIRHALSHRTSFYFWHVNIIIRHALSHRTSFYFWHVNIIIRHALSHRTSFYFWHVNIIIRQTRSITQNKLLLLAC